MFKWKLKLKNCKYVLVRVMYRKIWVDYVKYTKFANKKLENLRNKFIMV